MSLVDFDPRGYSRKTNVRHIPPSRRKEPHVIIAAEGVGEYALSAAELACIESKKTRDKLALSNQKVADFHRKVVRRVAVEQRGAGGEDGRSRGTEIFHTSSRVGTLESRREATLVHELGRRSWERVLSSDGAFQTKTPCCFQAVRIKGEPGDVKSLSDADTEARVTLTAYRSP